MLLVILIGWIVFSYAFAEFAPFIFFGILYFIRFLFLCLWEVIKLAAKALGWILKHVYRWLVRLFQRDVKDIYLGPEEEDAQEEPAEEPLVEEPANPYDHALSLLGLRPGFTRKMLKRAYRLTMRKAHPDAGGSKRAAQAVNSAYDLILRTHGWAR